MTTSTSITPAEAQAKVLGHITSQAKASAADLAPLWSALPPITVAKALGTYHGGLFTGKPANGTAAPRDPINWWGKQLISETSVNPLLANAPSNTSADGRDRSIIFPYPRANIAQVRNVEHEGVVSATIIYAKLPLMDYFRVVKDEGGELVLLGKSDLRGQASNPPYFYLRREEGVKIDFKYPNPYPNSSGF
jgi:hypothetical protein